MKTHAITKSLITGIVLAAVAGGGLAAAGQAGAVGLPDLAVTQRLQPMGCDAVVTNIGGATAKSVTVRQVPFDNAPALLGDIAPGETKVRSFIDCAFVIGGIRVVATTASIDSNPFNNVAKIYP